MRMVYWSLSSLGIVIARVLDVTFAYFDRRWARQRERQAQKSADAWGASAVRHIRMEGKRK
jgi:hypothetical protein